MTSVDPYTDPPLGAELGAAQGDPLKRLLNAALAIRNLAEALFTGPPWPTPAPGSDLRATVWAQAERHIAVRRHLDECADEALRSALVSGLTFSDVEQRVGLLRRSGLDLLHWAQCHRGRGAESSRSPDPPDDRVDKPTREQIVWAEAWEEWDQRLRKLQDAGAAIVRLRIALLGDGPVPPDQFRWKGKTAKDLPPAQFKLLAILWGKGPLGTRSATDTVVAELYQGSATKANRRALYGLADRLQVSLRRDKVFLVVRIEKKRIWLEATEDEVVHAKSTK
jgi:hypothetical protein